MRRKITNFFDIVLPKLFYKFLYRNKERENVSMKYTADFETTTDPTDCRVWATGICEIESLNFEYGNDIDFFFQFMETHLGAVFYFHNLKFDGEFIMCELFKRGFVHITDKNFQPKMFNTLISDTGQFYSIEVCFEKVDGKPKTVIIYDSLKILPFSVDSIAKGFNLPISKLEIDYHDTREIGHIITTEEVDYLRNDVEIMARALKTLFEQGLNKMTQGSNALYDYKRTVGNRNFLKWFPTPAYDWDIRQSYKGGFTYCDPRKQGEEVGEGIVLDVNSLYPSVMYYENLPYGEGVNFEGKYEEDKLYNLYTQMFKCQFTVKEDHIPTIQIKKNSSFIPTEYIRDSGVEEVTLVLTNVDLELFFEHYDVYNIEWLGGWKFKSTNGLFKDYIDKWMKIKIESTINGNKAMRTLAKLMLNALYGKFALNPNVQGKIPYYVDGGIKYTLGQKETRKPIYIPVGAFITAYARRKTITSAQTVYDRFLYADTDSLHLLGTEIPENLEIDEVKLGAWAHESTFTRARFIRQKTYIEEINGKINITCAGMPNRCYANVTWENFKAGSSFEGKLQFTHVQGGIVLKDIDFTIKP